MQTGQDWQDLRKASEYCGIQSEFWDIFGHHHVASPAALKSIVTSLGFRSGHIQQDLSDREHECWSRLVDRCDVTRANKVSLHLPESLQDAALTVEITI